MTLEKLEYGKIYQIKKDQRYSEYTSQAVYLGEKLTKKFMINKHFFMIWDNKMQLRDRPKIVACKDFEIKENKLELSASKRNYRTLSKPEEEYIKELAKKYWG